MKRFSQTSSPLLATLCVAVLAGCSPAPQATPYYGQILLGPDKSEASKRLQFITVGPDLYIDANQNGTAEPSEKSTPGTQTTIAPGGSVENTFTIAAVIGIAADAVSETLPQRLNLTVDIIGPTNYQMTGTLIMSAAPSSEHWLHFGGPLKLFTDPEPSVRKGAEPDINNPLRVYIGTTANGSIEDNNSVTDSPLADSSTASTDRRTIVAPVQQAPFPTAAINFVIADGEPISRTQTMDHFC